VLVASHFAVAAHAQQPIAWQQDLEGAKRLAAETNRLVVVHFWAPWCDPCMALEESVFNRPGVAEQLEAKFVLVKLNVDAHRAVAAQYGVRSIPTDVVIKPDGSVVGTTPSPQLPQHYLGRLNQIASSAAPVKDIAASTEPAGARKAEAPKEDRYANYYRNPSEQALAAPPVAAPNLGYQAPPIVPHAASMATANQVPLNQPLPASAGQAPPSAAPWQQPSVRAPSAAPSAPWTAAAGQPQQSAPPMAPMQPQVQPQPGQGAGQAAMGLPPGSPPLGLDGYCPVQLIESWAWVVGDRQWGAIHEGRTYLFAGPKERQMFLDNPHKYAPVESGDDAVVLREQGLRVPGRRECGGVYDGRLYLFSSEESYARFEQAAKLAGSQQHPSPYAVPVMQAMRPR
jgi:thiol-disulfide isomerase/thioredoxin/YHS domain-containing protein